MALGKELLYIIRAKDDASKEIQKVKRSFDDTDASAEKLGKTLSLTSGILTKEVGQSIQSVGKAMLSTLFDFEEAGRQSIQTTKALNAVLQSTKGAAGLSAAEVQNLANALSQVTNFEDDTVLRGQNMLLTFTHIGKDVFPQATEAMLNMATAMGTDVASQAIQLGKALNNPMEGLSALTRVGVAFNDQQKAMIEKMVEAGDVAGAQKIILAELQVEFGGLARATVDAKTQLTNSMNEIKESIGKALVPALDSAAKALLPVLNTVNQWITDNPELAKTIGMIALALAGMVTVMGTLIVVLGTAAAALAALGVTLAVGGALALAIGGITSLVVVLTQQWEGLRWMVTNAAQQMQDAIGGFALDLANKFGIADSAAKKLIATLKSAAQEALSMTLSALPVVGAAFQNSNVPQRATGGFGDGLTLVGERGPELVDLPRGSYVHTANQSKRMMQGSSQLVIQGNMIGTVHVHDEADETRLADTIMQKIVRAIQLQPLQAA